MLTVGAPDPKTKQVSAWPFSCFYCFRILALLLSFLSISAQVAVSIYGIKNPKFYDDVSYGFCSQCYNLNAC
jgi:hypothetical protein